MQTFSCPSMQTSSYPCVRILPCPQMHTLLCPSMHTSSIAIWSTPRNEHSIGEMSHIAKRALVALKLRHSRCTKPFSPVYEGGKTPGEIGIHNSLPSQIHKTSLFMKVAKLKTKCEQQQLRKTLTFTAMISNYSQLLSSNTIHTNIS